MPSAAATASASFPTPPCPPFRDPAITGTWLASQRRRRALSCGLVRGSHVHGDFALCCVAFASVCRDRPAFLSSGIGAYRFRNLLVTDHALGGHGERSDDPCHPCGGRDESARTDGLCHRSWTLTSTAFFSFHLSYLLGDDDSDNHDHYGHSAFFSGTSISLGGLPQKTEQPGYWREMMTTRLCHDALSSLPAWMRRASRWIFSHQFD